ncbi:MAG TPA: SusD/RagB family nutrient-binding outer membrane lipoprotein [Puia sp.]|nr:SusD/RagB family nutrient-binding outer membrane lipoprotein [Puia sp.]
MTKIFKYTVVLVLLSGGMSGCTKNFNSINTNPASYNQSDFDPNFLLTTAEVAYTGSYDFAYDTWRANLIYASGIIQGFSTVLSYWDGDKYKLSASYTAAYWGFSGDGAYSEQMKPIVDIIQSTTGKPQYKNLHEIARIMRVLIAQRITDLYGDCPYSEAGLGYYSKNYFPKYDKQQDIYNDMLTEVSDAVANLDPTADKPAGDMIYKGDVDKWKRFGNTLILRIAMRLTKVDPATAKTWVTKVIGATMTSNADNAFINGDNSGGLSTINRNSLVLTGEGGQEPYYVKWSDTYINLLKSAGDPRLGKVAVTQLYTDPNSIIQNTAYNASPSVQKGMPNGKDLSGIAGRDISTDPSYTSMPDYSSPNPGMIKTNGPTFILTYGESELLLAEAAERFAIGGSAAQHYHDGVKAAITYLSQYDPALAISDGDAETFVTSHPYNAANGLQMINTQYWMLTNSMLDFYESWANWRRSGYPALVPVVYPNNVTGGSIPRRFPYPLAESNVNPDNYKPASAAVPGGDNLTGRVWWDKQ